jgi:glucans biosynthesis protein C
MSHIGGKSLDEYFALFMLGYIILSEETMQVKLDRNRWYLFGGLVVLTVLNMLFQNVWHCSFGTIYDIFTGFLSWIGILAILGIGKHYLDFYNNVTNYFTKASFPIYIFHQSLVVVVAYYALKITSSIAKQVIVIIGVSFILTMLTYELFKRIFFTRFLFGIKE